MKWETLYYVVLNWKWYPFPLSLHGFYANFYTTFFKALGRKWNEFLFNAFFLMEYNFNMSTFLTTDIYLWVKPWLSKLYWVCGPERVSYIHMTCLRVVISELSATRTSAGLVARRFSILQQRWIKTEAYSVHKKLSVYSVHTHSPNTHSRVSILHNAHCMKCV